MYKKKHIDGVAAAGMYLCVCFRMFFFFFQERKMEILQTLYSQY